MYTVFLCKLTYSNCCTFLQVFCLLKGKISVTIHRTKRIVEAGDMFFIPQGKLLLQRIVMAHRAYSYSLCNVEITWISFRIIVMQYIDMYCTCTCLASSIHNEFCTIGCWPCFNFHMLNSNKLLNDIFQAQISFRTKNNSLFNESRISPRHSHVPVVC